MRWHIFTTFAASYLCSREIPALSSLRLAKKRKVKAKESDEEYLGDQEPSAAWVIIFLLSSFCFLPIRSSSDGEGSDDPIAIGDYVTPKSRFKPKAEALRRAPTWVIIYLFCSLLTPNLFFSKRLRRQRYEEVQAASDQEDEAEEDNEDSSEAES